MGLREMRAVNWIKEGGQSLCDEGESRSSDRRTSDLGAARNKVTLLSFMTTLILVCCNGLQLHDTVDICVISPCLVSLAVSSSSFQPPLPPSGQQKVSKAPG